MGDCLGWWIQLVNSFVWLKILAVSNHLRRRFRLRHAHLACRGRMLHRSLQDRSWLLLSREESITRRVPDSLAFWCPLQEDWETLFQQHFAPNPVDGTSIEYRQVKRDRVINHSSPRAFASEVKATLLVPNYFIKDTREEFAGTT